MAVVESIPIRRANPVDVLNRLLVIEYRSLPMYLRDACPWTHPGDERASAVLNQIVADQKTYSSRLADAVLDRSGAIELGGYPMEYTDTHMLSLDFLVGELVRCQKRDITAIERCVAELTGDPPARALAEEVLGNARGHLDSLQELAADVKSHGATRK
jgi:hypothetical protein